MSLVIKDTSCVPPEDWTYTVNETATTITVKSYVQLYPKIVQHCQSNNVPIPTEQEVIDNLCANLHIPCYEGMVPLVNKWSLGIPMPTPTGCCGKQ